MRGAWPRVSLCCCGAAAVLRECPAGARPGVAGHPRCDETAAPHCGQKRADASSGARHAPHAGGVCDAPHCAQNFASAPLIAPHFAHAALCAGALASPRSGAPSRARSEPPPRGAS
ncbi:hypothetical protein WS76_00735 [Burkholderia humptydooensis]|nr:hypothetical protein WS76_00735 [Burkholderia humptydooensis]